MLREIVADSFNMISVDRDTSTNDTCVLLANGAAGAEEIKKIPMLIGRFMKQFLM